MSTQEMRVFQLVHLHEKDKWKMNYAVYTFLVMLLLSLLWKSGYIGLFV